LAQDISLLSVGMYGTAAAATEEDIDAHFDNSAAPSSANTPTSLHGSPVRGVWMAEPPSIDEPLMLLDAGDDDAQDLIAATVARLREELAAARGAGKSSCMELEAMTDSTDLLASEHRELRAASQRLEDENRFLRHQLQDHHGIMAADWAQTLGFQQRLRQEEAANERLVAEVAELRESVAARAEEATTLRQDAARWQLLRAPSPLDEVASDELDGVLEVAMPAMVRLHAEVRARGRQADTQLRDELEQQLCVVCRDNKKVVLFIPCLHVCVCEQCRGRLRPYRCPICKEPIQNHLGRLHL